MVGTSERLDAPACLVPSPATMSHAYNNTVLLSILGRYCCDVTTLKLSIKHNNSHMCIFLCNCCPAEGCYFDRFVLFWLISES